MPWDIILPCISIACYVGFKYGLRVKDRKYFNRDWKDDGTHYV
jgi:hypothetical protein